MNRLIADKNLQSKKKTGISHPLMFFATFVLCVVVLNADWGGIRVLWWSCVAFFVLSWFLTSEMRFVVDVNYTVWSVSFFAFCAMSILWAHSTLLVTTALKSLFVQLIILLLLRSSVRNEKEVNNLLFIIASSSVINALYLIITNFEMLTSNVGQDIGTRLGAEGDWNANSVGMMAAVAALILLYNFKKTQSIFTKGVYMLTIVAMIVVSLLSGSRKALFIVVLGIIGFLLLASQKKKIRTVLSVIFFVFVLYYSIIKIPFFYSIIGWRVEGFIAMLTGEGVVDSSTEYRQVLIKTAIDTWKQFPIIGCGLDCFRNFALIFTGKSYYAHNNYVELLADLGMVGTFIYYGGYLFVLTRLLPKLRKGSNLDKLFVTLLGIIVVIDYACVSYSDFLFKIIFLAMFATITVNRKSEVEESCLSE